MTSLRRGSMLLFLLLCASAPRSASATWSIVAVDPETREVGVAGASCILGVDQIMGLAPGRGAVAAQAMTNLDGRETAIEMLEEGHGPREIVEAIAGSDFDSFLGIPLHRLRQYGVAALDAEDHVASFTGSWTVDHAGARRGESFAVQGNMLYGASVLDRALEAFGEAADGCRPTLADRLVRALTAGAAEGGDRRCARNLSAVSAFVAVARPEDTRDAPWLHLSTLRPGEPPLSFFRELGRFVGDPEPASPEENPATLLGDAYRRWRRENETRPLCD